MQAIVQTALLLAWTMMNFAEGGRSDEPDALAPPVRILAAGQPLDLQREGHSAPCVGDFDGDGIFDLLVGQYDDGRLRIYRNLGTNAAPKFESFTWFQAGDDFGRVPFG